MPRCKCCKEKFEPKYFLQKFCMIKDECIAAFTEWHKDHKQKETDKKWKKEKNVLKQKLKTLGKLENEAKTEFQKWVRLRDKDLPCISCGNHETTLWDGGHFYKAEIYSGLIFDERNCNKQCRKCNRYLGGNENNYRLGLIKRFGRPYVLQLDADAIKLRNYTYERDQLIDIKKEYQNKLKELANN